MKLKNKRLFFCILPFLFSLVPLASCSESSHTNPITSEPEPIIPFPPTSNNSTLNPSGGTYGSLQVSSYLELIKSLNIQQSTPLSSLTSNNLTNQLKNIDSYKNLSLTINDDSNEREGKLVLLLNGVFNKQTFNNERIEITNFSNDVANKIYVSNLKINLKKWFESNQPIKEKKDLALKTNIQEILSLLESADFSFYNNDTYVNSLSLDVIKKYYNFKEVAMQLSNDAINFVFKLETNYKKYSSNQWIMDTNQNEITQPSNHSVLVNLPTINDLSTFMIYQFVVSDSIKEKYASYFYGNAKYFLNESSNQSEITTYINSTTIINQYKNTYFPTKTIVFRIDNSSVQANDFNGTLSFGCKLVDFDSSSIDYAVRNFNVSGMKLINPFIEENQQENIILIKDGSSLAKQFSTLIKDKVIEAFNSKTNQQKEIVLNTFNTNWSRVYNFDLPDQDITRINNNYILSIFGDACNLVSTDNSSLQKNTLNIKNGLFQKGDDIFFIQNLSFSFNNNLVQINYTNPGRVHAWLDAELNIDLLGGDTITQKAKFNLYFTEPPQ